MPRITISGTVLECLRGLHLNEEFSNEAIYGWCDGSGLEYYYNTVDTVLQLLRLNGFIEQLRSQRQKRKWMVEYKLIRKIPKDFTYKQLITLNEIRKENEKRNKNGNATKSAKN